MYPYLDPEKKKKLSIDISKIKVFSESENSETKHLDFGCEKSNNFYLNLNVFNFRILPKCKFIELLQRGN